MLFENDMVTLMMRYLIHDPELIAELGTFANGDGETYPMLIYELRLPDEWPTDSSKVNIYPISSMNGAADWKLGWFSASCRASSFTKSREIASLVCDALNRRNGDGMSITASIASTIAPYGEMDNFNTPVEIRVKLS